MDLFILPVPQMNENKLRVLESIQNGNSKTVHDSQSAIKLDIRMKFVEWHQVLHDRVDEHLKRVTPTGLDNLRISIVNNAILDILYYLTPHHQQVTTFPFFFFSSFFSFPLFLLSFLPFTSLLCLRPPISFPQSTFILFHAKQMFLLFRFFFSVHLLAAAPFTSSLFLLFVPPFPFSLSASPSMFPRVLFHSPFLPWVAYFLLPPSSVILPFCFPFWQFG